MDTLEKPQLTAIEGLIVVPKRIISDKRGSIFHMLRSDAPYIEGDFGEVYFSSVKPGVVKGWKRHRLMTQRFAVPHGSVHFVFFDDRVGSRTNQHIVEIKTGPQNYALVLVPPMIWYSFRGGGNHDALIANCSSMAHLPSEVDAMPLEEAVAHVPYEWKVFEEWSFET
jgi:dTDP-4-dehydrorhamnose 3,5-epimerase